MSVVRNASFTGGVTHSGRERHITLLGVLTYANPKRDVGGQVLFTVTDDDIPGLIVALQQQLARPKRRTRWDAARERAAEACE